MYKKKKREREREGIPFFIQIITTIIYCGNYLFDDSAFKIRRLFSFPLCVKQWRAEVEGFGAVVFIQSSSELSHLVGSVQVNANPAPPLPAHAPFFGGTAASPAIRSIGSFFRVRVCVFPHHNNIITCKQCHPETEGQRVNGQHSSHQAPPLAQPPPTAVFVRRQKPLCAPQLCVSWIRDPETHKKKKKKLSKAKKSKNPAASWTEVIYGVLLCFLFLRYLLGKKGCRWIFQQAFVGLLSTLLPP